jgi:hypothetical protein
VLLFRLLGLRRSTRKIVNGRAMAARRTWAVAADRTDGPQNHNTEQDSGPIRTPNMECGPIEGKSSYRPRLNMASTGTKNGNE